ncbi:MAG TPA: NAD(P)-binding domain-containing protein [Gemmatimonadales bacterium]|nr:NAD(P)-binding domain-containing protein [Gemmatimonadales bacterium]
MKIGIIGSGVVGQALGSGFAALGHAVTLGTREPDSDKLKLWRKEAGSQATTASFAETAAAGEVLVLATSWAGTENAIRLADPTNFAGKVVIDVTNPLAMRPNAPPSLAVGHTDSAGERVQGWLPLAFVVKAFNIVGNAHMFRPQFPGGPPDMFIAGNSAPAKRTVSDILTAFGWEVIDVGGIESARYLESLAMLWITYGLRTNTWNHAFKLLRRT